jgi:APA family basic amino acid/polyamine antiporter
LNNPPDNKNKEKQFFGLWTSTALVVGNMIGSGIFLLPSALAAYGGISIFGWIFTTIGSVLLSIVFMNLSREFPKIGGPYAFAREAFGNFAGFIVAYGYWISILCGNAAIAIASVSYFSIFFPILSSTPYLNVLAALATLWILTFINLLGVRVSGRIQLITAILKLLPFIGIALLGFFYFNPDHFSPFNVSKQNSFDAITATAVLTLWAFLGLESATIPADKIKDPKHTIPKATLIGTLVVALVYILSTVSIMGTISPNDLLHSNAPFADAAAKMFSSAAGSIIAGSGIVACIGALNGWILLQSQMPLAAALDNLFPKKFRLLSKTKTPAWGIVISSILISFLMLLNYTEGFVEKFTFVILLATLATLVSYLLSTLAQLKFVLKAKNKKSSIKLMIITVLAFLYSAWAVMGLGAYTIFWGIILITTGVPIFIWMRVRRNSNSIDDNNQK